MVFRSSRFLNRVHVYVFDLLMFWFGSKAVLWIFSRSHIDIKRFSELRLILVDHYPDNLEHEESNLCEKWMLEFGNNNGYNRRQAKLYFSGFFASSDLHKQALDWSRCVWLYEFVLDSDGEFENKKERFVQTLLYLGQFDKVNDHVVWCSAFEVGLRMFYLGECFKWLNEHGELTQEECDFYHAVCYLHYFILKNSLEYSNGNFGNHFLGNLLGICSSLPFVALSAREKRNVLATCRYFWPFLIRRFILIDGGYFERASGYHILVCQMLEQYYLLLNQNGSLGVRVGVIYFGGLVVCPREKPVGSVINRRFDKMKALMRLLMFVDAQGVKGDFDNLQLIPRRDFDDGVNLSNIGLAPLDRQLIKLGTTQVYGMLFFGLILVLGQGFRYCISFYGKGSRYCSGHEHGRLGEVVILPSGQVQNGVCWLKSYYSGDGRYASRMALRECSILGFPDCVFSVAGRSPFARLSAEGRNVVDLVPGDRKAVFLSRWGISRFTLEISVVIDSERPEPLFTSNLFKE